MLMHLAVAGLVQGSYLPIEANPNITWEVANKTDIGFEANLWRGLLRIEADYFNEKRTGMLLPPARLQFRWNMV